MDKLSMCRVCLVKDVPMRSIVNKSLRQVYEDLTKIRFLSQSRRPALVCVMCCARLQSCQRFKASCLQGEALLKQILNKDAAFTIEEEQRPVINKLCTTPIKHIVCPVAVGIEDQVSEDSPQQSTLMHAIVTEVNAVYLQESASRDSQLREENESELMSEMMLNKSDRIITTVKIETCEGGDFEAAENIEWLVSAEAAAATAAEVAEVPQRAQSIETQQGEPEQPAPTDLMPASALTSNSDPIPTSDAIPTSNLTSTTNQHFQEKPSIESLLKAIKIVLQRCDNMISNKQIRSGPPSKILEDSSNKKQNYECDICNKRYDQDNILSTHRRLHFQDEKPFKCDVCNKSYNYKCTLVTHLRLHSGEKPYECGVCNKRFNEKTNLLSHIRTHTGEKPFECDVCKKTFIVKNYLTTHYRIHTGERPYKCDICNKTFRQRTLLVQHDRMHSGYKPYKCNICDASFKQNVSLRRHKRCHTEEKSFKCNVCDERFFKHSELVIHNRKHDGKRIYECDVCKKVFSMKSHVDTHMRKHTGQKPFKCFVCGKCFSQKYNLLKHVGTQHPTRPRRG